MEITVGIVTYERSLYLEKTLESLRSQSRAADELVIIDDSDSDESERVVDDFRTAFASAGTELVYVHRRESTGERTGMTEARNRVLEAASGDVVCYIDDDVVCPEGWLAAYEAAHEEFSEAAVIGGPALDVDEAGDEVELVETPENQNRLNKYGECQLGSPNWVPPTPVQTHHFRGANMSFKRAALEGVGGFNPVYQGPAFFEEIDVIARLWKAGEDIIYHPDVKLYHLTAGGSGDVTSQTENPDVWYWAARNGLVFRHHVFPEMFLVGLVRIVFHPNTWPGPLWKELGAYLVTWDERRRMAIRGYLDGLRQVLAKAPPDPTSS